MSTYPTIPTIETAPDTVQSEAPTAGSKMASTGRSAVPTIPVIPSRTQSPISRPIRPPAHLPPRRLPASASDSWEDMAEQDRGELATGTTKARSPLAATSSFSIEPDRTELEANAARVNLAAQVTRTQAVVAAAVSFVAAALALGGQPSAVWVLALTVLLGIGAGSAHLVLQGRETREWASAILLGSQLGVLAWAFAFAGMRSALLISVPALAVLALRLSGRKSALYTTFGALTLYLVLAFGRISEIVPPLLSASGSMPTPLDAGLATAGLVLSLAAVLTLHADQVKALQVAERRRRDAQDVLAGYSLLQQSVRRDAARLEVTLTAALRSEFVDPIAPHVAEPALYQLAELLDLAAERLETLHRDREDRVRLEGALRRLDRAISQVERGSPLSWPEPSGTLVDPLVAILRGLHPDPDLPHIGNRHLLSLVPTPRASATSTPPTRGRTTGVILSWRPSRSSPREPVETKAAAESVAWPPFGGGDESGSPA